MSDVHSAASQGFGMEAKTYARGRPEYPASLLPWLKQEIGLAPGKSVIDLGSGTGKFSTLLVQSGARVLAVEPVATMRDPDFLAEAQKGRMRVEPVDWQTLTKLVNELNATPREVVDRVAGFMK